MMESKINKKFGKKERNYQKTIQELNRQHADDLRKVLIMLLRLYISNCTRKVWRHFFVR